MLNPLIAKDLNAGRGAMSGGLSLRESAMNVLHFTGHLLISTFGVGVAAAVLTYAVVLPLQLFFPSLGRRSRLQLLHSLVAERIPHDYPAELLENRLRLIAASS
jgi:hypothetical protein